MLHHDLESIRMYYKIIPSHSIHVKHSLEPLNVYKNSLLDSIQSGIKVFGNEYIKIYEFFNNISFIVLLLDEDTENRNVILTEINKRGVILENNNVYMFKCYHLNHTMGQTIHNFIEVVRKSKTYKQSEKNTFYAKEIEISIFEYGFVQKDIFALNDGGKDKFERTLIIYLLGIAYNMQSEWFIEQAASKYENNNFEQLIDLQCQVHHFDLKYYFKRPIKHSSYQMMKIWKLIYENLHVESTHHEMKQQLIELSDVIRSEQSRLLEQKNKRTEFKISIITVCIGIASLISVLKDLLH